MSAKVKPVLIIGAARSGTNMLRNVLTRLSGIETWPCDEINYIWRHGNARHETDELTETHARPAVIKYIRGQFEAIARAQKANLVVEKTCANTLRIPFVNAVLPEAHFIHIVREGHDVVASAMKRWTAKMDMAYVARKARYVPGSDLPYYAFRYLHDRLQRIRTEDRRLGGWGPRFRGMQDALRTRSLPEICALQWRACIEKASADLALLGPNRVFNVRYSEFVHDPERHVRAITEFLDLHVTSRDLRLMVQGVSARSVGNWKRDLTSDQVSAIESIVNPVVLPKSSILPVLP